EGTKIVLVSGKMSERSAKRFGRFPRFSKRLFSHFDCICTQNEDHLQKFLPFIANPSILHATGNLKLDLEPQMVGELFDLPRPVITISCTHRNEEELLLEALEGGPWSIILAPRHPERFAEV